MVEIKDNLTPDDKQQICESILRTLPSWFGVEASLVAYTKEVRELPFLAAYEGDTCAGFLAIKKHNQYTAEIHVLGVRPEYHRQGIGRALVTRCETICRADGAEFLTVKTLDESRPSASYEKTRRFYLAMGFRPLEVFPLLWDKDNPCLLMVKHL